MSDVNVIPAGDVSRTTGASLHWAAAAERTPGGPALQNRQGWSTWVSRLLWERKAWWMWDAVR